jgi:fermentation-respiration switch protein FrsA (DUF1100 family)
MDGRNNKNFFIRLSQELIKAGQMLVARWLFNGQFPLSPMSVRLACSIPVFLVIAFFMFQALVNRVLYYPMRYPEGDWSAQQKSRAQDVWLTTADGVRLNAWWFSNPDAALATLFLHGNAGNVTHRIDHAHAVTQAGSSILVLDYRGYGKSTGHPDERGLYLDAEAAYEQLVRRGYPPSWIILQGESLGTAVATELASRRQCAGLVLESPFTSLSSMAGVVLPIIGPLVAHGFDTEKKIPQVHVPLLLMHGDADEVIPFSQGEAVYKLANEPKAFWRVAGAHHNDLLDVAGREYVPRLRGFYRSIVVGTF